MRRTKNPITPLNSSQISEVGKCSVIVMNDDARMASDLPTLNVTSLITQFSPSVNPSHLDGCTQHHPHVRWDTRLWHRE